MQQTESTEEMDGRRSNFPAILEQWRQKERTASGSSTSSGGSSGSSRSFDSDLVQPLTRSEINIYSLIFNSVFRIRIGFNADPKPDPGSQTNSDPDPDPAHILPSKSDFDVLCR